MENMDGIMQFINTVGFPIFCVIALGFFIYRSYEAITRRNCEREEKLYTLIGKAQEQLDKLEEINQSFVVVLEKFKEDNAEIKRDIEDIKETVRKLPKRKGDKSEEE